MSSQENENWNTVDAVMSYLLQISYVNSVADSLQSGCLGDETWSASSPFTRFSYHYVRKFTAASF